MSDVSETHIVEPGDEVIVVEGEPEGGEHDEHVDIDDFSSTVDDSTTVIVNVETPDAEPEVMPEWAARLEGKMDAVLALQVVDVVLDQEPEPEPVIVEPEPEEVLVVEEVEPETEPEPEPTTETEKRRTRRFGR